jgi:hypothetical protein
LLQYYALTAVVRLIENKQAGGPTFLAAVLSDDANYGLGKVRKQDVYKAVKRLGMSLKGKSPVPC